MTYAQKRLKPPKNNTNIASVDQFIKSAFTIYDTVYEFQHGADEASASLDEAEVSTTIESQAKKEQPEDEFEVLESSIMDMIDQVPDMIEDIEKQSVAKQVRATLNLNKAIKALKQSGKIVKLAIKGE